MLIEIVHGYQADDETATFLMHSKSACDHASGTEFRKGANVKLEAHVLVIAAKMLHNLANKQLQCKA